MRKGIKGSLVAAATAVAALAGATQASADIVQPTVEVDTAKVAQILHEKLGDGNTVGYAFAISEDGVFAASGSGGKARIDKNIAFTPYTRMDIASATKNIAGAALLKLVEARGVSLDTKLWGYLPLDLRSTMHESWKNLTIRQILGHRSGIAQMTASLSDADKANVGTLYAGVKFTMTKPIVVDSPWSYTNMNYAVARLIIPKLWDLVEPGRGVPDVTATNSGGWTLAYINERLLAPAGIAPTSCVPVSADTAPHAYDIADTAKGGVLVQLDGADWEACGGHRGLHLSAMDMVRWQAHLRHGTVVSPTVRFQMDSFKLGWYETMTNTGAWAGSYTHGGDLFLGGSREQHSCQGKFPGGVEVAVLMNSKVLSGYQCSVVLNAVKDATTTS
ncbi:serine hydrolase domain-containing protein [Actinokineospora sp. HUAS TT18]|uniref:serine hydrolase domain-containing protein n=1 Tax=Actinokineospora sp. HUAS TT18 TaxID=3447451 RepID=UPI003F52680D